MRERDLAGGSGSVLADGYTSGVLSSITTADDWETEISSQLGFERHDHSSSNDSLTSAEPLE